MAERYTGRVKWFNPTKKFGFITRRDEGDDVFLHLSEWQGGGHPKEGMRVSFEIEYSPKGPQAVSTMTIEEWERLEAEWQKEAEAIAAARYPMDWTYFYAQASRRVSGYDEKFCDFCDTTDSGDYAEFADGGGVICQSCWETRRKELCDEVRGWRILQFQTPYVEDLLADDGNVSHLIGRDDLRQDREKALRYVSPGSRPDEDGRPPDWKAFGRRAAAIHQKSW